MEHLFYCLITFFRSGKHTFSLSFIRRNLINRPEPDKLCYDKIYYQIPKSRFKNYAVWMHIKIYFLHLYACMYTICSYIIQYNEY